MPIADLPLFSMLRTRMQWHQERQRLLAENVANSDTPNFKSRDLAPLSFDQTMQTGGGINLSRTEAGHIASSVSSSTGFASSRMGDYEVRPTGSTSRSILEDEMIKVSANQMDFQAATTLYTRSLDLIKTAIGRK